MKRKGLRIWRKIAVELQSSCNRDCVFCPRHGNDTGVRKNADGRQIIQKMPTEKAKDIILQAEALGYQGKISFHRLSESFLDPRYIEMAEFAVAHGLRVFDNTNGDILKRKPGLIKELDGLVEYIKIGLYDYATWKEKKAEMDFWNAQFEKTRIEFSCPLEIPEIRQGARLQTERSKRVAKRRHEKILDLPCTGPLRALLVRYDGEVSICCQDDEATFKLGNAFETPIEDIWWSDKHVKISLALLEPKSRHQFPLCSQCYRKQGNPTGWEAFKQTVWTTGFRMGMTSPVVEAQKPERLVINLDGLLDGMPDKESKSA